MIHHPKKNTRAGFTLIELLTVIAIIGILAAMTFGIAGYVGTARRNAKANGEVSVLTTKLEEFKTRFGEYPMPESSSEADCERALFNAMTGRWYYKSVNGVRMWEKKLESGTGEERHPFVESGLVGTNVTSDNPNDTPTKFVDPWGNAYRYRYGRLNTSTGKADISWDRPGFLLISAGEKIQSQKSEADGGTLPDSEFFQGNESATGMVDTTQYFDDTYRKDNITNFRP